MNGSRKKLLKDPNPNQLATETARPSEEEPSEETPKRSTVSEYLAAIGRKGGLKGGKARAKKLSSKKRSEIARKAAKSRWRNSSKPRQ